MMPYMSARIWGVVCLFLIALTAVGMGEEATQAESPGGFVWPERLIDRELVVTQGIFEIGGDTLGINLSRRLVGDPVFSAPDVWYGYKPRLALGVTHRRGFCFTDPCSGYSDIAFAGRYSLLKGSGVELAGEGALDVRSFSDPFAVGLFVGLRSKVIFNDVGVFFDPQIYLGVIGSTRLPSTMELPFTVAWQWKRNTAWFLRFAWAGPLSDFSQFVRIPVGVGGALRFHEHAEIAGEFRFENLFGRGATFDRRSLLIHLRIWFRK